jgi:hypothetical protein
MHVADERLRDRCTVHSWLLLSWRVGRALLYASIISIADREAGFENLTVDSRGRDCQP